MEDKRKRYARDIDKEILNMEELYSIFGCDFTHDVAELMTNTIVGETDCNVTFCELVEKYRKGFASANDIFAMFSKNCSNENKRLMVELISDDPDLSEDAKLFIEDFHKNG